MTKVTLTLLTLIVSFGHIAAQSKLLSLDAIFSTDPAVRVNFLGAPSYPEWTNDGRAFVEVRGNKFLRVDAVSGNVTEILDISRFSVAASKAGISSRANNEALEPIFNRDESAFIFSASNDLYLYNIAAANIRRLTKTPAEEKEFDFSPDGKWISFIRGNNLFVVNAASGVERQLTRDGREGAKPIHNGYLDWLYEEELYGRGEKRAYWWSLDSKYIAFLRLDESPVPKFLLANDIPTGQELENTDYPKAGDPNPIARLGIADVGTNTVAKFVDLSSYKPDDLLLVRVAWTPDSREVFFQAQNRVQSYLDLDAAGLNGKMRKVFRETSPTWVGINDNPFFLKDGSFIWESERDGWNHLYHYARDGRLIKRLTSGEWEVRIVQGVDAENRWVYFTSILDDPVAENVYRMPVTGGEIERLTRGRGTHSPTFNSTFTRFVDNWSDIDTPPQSRLFRSDGTLERVINENKVAALNEYKLSRTEFLKVKTRDGYEMEAMMIKPPDFDPSRRYPVLIYNYSGPHAPSVVDAWGYSRYMWHQMLAEKGYIIWICDNRTASGKGLKPTFDLYKHFGESEFHDIEDGVRYLNSLPFVDSDRIGIWGWSYGGFMTAYALTHSKLFKIGMAGGLVSDWRNYDSIYTERYMLTPAQNPAGYDRSAVQKFAKDLSGRLLLMHGMMDNNVHVQNTTQFAYELQKAGKQFDLMLYPTQRHVIGDDAQEKHWYTMMTEFVLKNL